MCRSFRIAERLGASERGRWKISLACSMLSWRKTESAYRCALRGKGDWRAFVSACLFMGLPSRFDRRAAFDVWRKIVLWIPEFSDKDEKIIHDMATKFSAREVEECISICDRAGVKSVPYLYKVALNRMAAFRPSPFVDAVPFDDVRCDPKVLAEFQ